ncbi:hypothetical protein GALMADRAFT_215881 [Galerina marginata CBS 339.88]|uniref:Uncharacterized protein n=1 Tax=Galerina marginata (strain CBS 339.88) TaxID=685588 RepID=A0A067SC31_GALM3|nr:hypothetical protein GALMADRAFT_215881 [Galerina marginata CBS 339.88]
MSTNSAHGSHWNNSGARSVHGRHPVERKSSDGESQSTYFSQYDMNELRPISSSSSLTGAMGDVNISHSRHSRSPTLSSSGHTYTGNMPNHGLSWNPAPQMNMTIAMNNSAYPGVPGHGGLSFPDMSQSELGMSLNDYSTTRNVSPESLSPNSPNYPQDYSGAYGTAGRGTFPSQHGGGGMGFHGSSATSMHPTEDKNQIAALQRRIRELEHESRRAKLTLQSIKGGLPGAPQSPAFQAAWRARTETRKKIFCSLNRAGNALCAWHDSRRERRIFAPRQAPEGYLNCGCTFEEALFEESLARHNVGSYLPGEGVRMDPALRNPLLKLLVARYGYKDGDFEHDPFTETWEAGESSVDWDQKAKSKQFMKRRSDSDRS